MSNITTTNYTYYMSHERDLNDINFQAIKICQWFVNYSVRRRL